MKQTVLIAGFGGQGILLIGQMLAEAAMNEGYHTTWFPSYGPEMRGGTANCTTIYSDEEIGSPIAAIYDSVIAMNQPSLERFGPGVRAGGRILVNSSMVPIRFERPDVATIYLPAAALAKSAGSERIANVVMLGALLAAESSVRLDAMDAAIRAIVGKKHPDWIDMNMAALRAGHDAACEQLAAAH